MICKLCFSNYTYCMYRIFIFIILIFWFWSTIFAEDFSFYKFSNVNPLHFKKTISAGWITDNGDHIFAWWEIATREFFSQIMTSSTCTVCSIPSTTDITKYQKPSFNDIDQKNPYYYCIEKAKEKWSLWIKNTCSYIDASNTPIFCGKDGITRIEAVIALLNEAKIWDDTKNQQYKETPITIVDIPNGSYQYWYAVKAIQLWLVQIWTDQKLSPNTTISQWEALSMASVVRNFNQCQSNFWNSTTETVNIWVDHTWSTYTFKLISITWSIYRWSMGDGYISSSKNPEFTYTFESPKDYTVSVLVYESNSKVTTYSTKVTAWWTIDSDKDTVLDSDDICPLVFGILEQKWCPKIKTNNYGLMISNLLGGITQSNNSLLLAGMRANSCLLKYHNQQWLFVWYPVCDQCPCFNTVDILADIRSCDIVFPSILSPDFSSLYSRWAFYQIQ